MSVHHNIDLDLFFALGGYLGHLPPHIHCRSLRTSRRTTTTTMSPDQGDAIRRFATKDYLNRMEAALELGVSVKTLAKWAVEKKGPNFRKSANGTAFYERKALLEWRSRQAVTLRYSFVGDEAAAA